MSVVRAILGVSSVKLTYINLGITSVVILASSLLISLIYSDYSYNQKLVETSYRTSLTEIGDTLVYRLEQLPLQHPQLITHKASLQLLLQHYTDGLTGYPLHLLQIGIVNYPSGLTSELTTSPSLHNKLHIKPLWFSSQLQNGHILSDVFYMPQKNIPMLEIAFPIIQNRKLMGALYVVGSEISIAQSLQSLFDHQLIIGSLIAILTFTTACFIARFLRKVKRESVQLANWVDTLVNDPSAEPPSTLQLLDPLTQTILQMRKRLHQQDAMIQQIVKNAPLVIIHISRSHIIELINDTFSTVTGLSETTVIGESILSIAKCLEISPAIIDKIAFQLEPGAAIRGLELPFIHAVTREQKVIECSIVANSSSIQTATGVIVFAEDITTRKHWEVFTAKIDRLNLVAELAASTAHEIRNPLTTVRGFLQLQKRRNKNSTGKDHYHIMIEEIDRVDDLISEYLTLARNSTTTGSELVDLKIIIEDLLPLITAEANMKSVIMRIPELPSGVCLASKSQLKQVFLNLGKNALDAMPNGGILTIYGQLNNNLYTLVVADTGSGIAPIHLERVFDPFFTTKSTGSGLGLAISKKIIEAHHGEIQVKSEVNNGTTFYIGLPLQLYIEESIHI